jgi:hypothetical protein
METRRQPALSKRRALLVVIMATVVPYGSLMLRFSLRNDQTSYFLPVRMYMRDAFLGPEFMLLNPFMSGSYPMHCDMQGPVWNPIVIGLSWLFNYNSTVLSFELLLYFLIGAIGCFYFARNFSRNMYSCIVVAVIYGCGGFSTSILEFMSWVGSFAFLPWAVHFFYRLLTRRDIYSGLGLAVALWLMLVCGYPSFLIYLGYCLCLITLACLCRLWYERRGKEAVAIVKFGLLGLICFLLLSLPAIHSFFEYLPYYARGAKSPDDPINSEYFAWNYPMSLIFPTAAVFEWDDELYIGLLPLLILFCAIRVKPIFIFRDWVLLPGFVFTFLFTLGRSTPVRIWSAHHLPFMDAFGFSHNVSIFLLFALFVWLLPKLDHVFSGGWKEWLPGLRWAAGIATLLLLLYLMAGFHRIVFRTGAFRGIYYTCAFWQLFLLFLLIFPVRVLTSGSRVFWFILGDLMISVLAVAPLTGLSLTPPGVYNRSAAAFYRSSAGDVLLSPGKKLKEWESFDMRKQVKAFKITGIRDYPSHTRSDTFANYIAVDTRYRELLSLPFVFSDSGVQLRVDGIRLGYNFINVDVWAENSCRMVMQQTYYRRWKAADPNYKPFAYKGVFLAVPLRAGENRVRLYYYKWDLCIEGGISVVTLLVLGSIFFLRRVKSRRSRDIGGEFYV